MEPFTESEMAAYIEAMNSGNTEVAHDPLPPVNAKGGRDVPRGWTAIYEGTVTPRWCNSFGSIHGACHAWVVDNLCGFTLEVLATGEKWWGAPMAGGVTLGIEMAYYESTEIGRSVRASVRIDRMSGTNAFVTIDIDEIADGQVVKRLASGRQLQTWRKAKL